MLKHPKTKNFVLMDSLTYIFDKVKLTINKKNELVLSSTSSTVIREEKEDTFTVESLEFSQKDENEEEVKDDAAYYNDEALNNEQKNLIQFTTAK